MSRIEIKSILSERDKQPYVQIEVTDDTGTAHVQLTPEDATQQALFLLHAAEGAYTDHAMYDFIKNVLEGDDLMVSAVLHTIREYRSKREFQPKTMVIKQ